MKSDLEQSYCECRAIARGRAKNFYYAFLLLPRAQKDAMCAIYAFMRYCDDLSDEPGATREPLERWRTALERALTGKYDSHPTMPAFHDAVRRYKIPHHYFHEMIDGVTSDLKPRRIQTFDELYRYCYQVASVVGLATIHVLGFDEPAAVPLAEKCGVAFQLTNIIRDVREDWSRGRIYLPGRDLGRFHVEPEDLGAGTPTPAFRDLMRFESARAREYYAAAQPLVGMVHKRSRSSLRALIGIYSGLLTKIEKSNYDVLSQRVALTPLEKSWIVIRAKLHLVR